MKTTIRQHLTRLTTLVAVAAAGFTVQPAHAAPQAVRETHGSGLEGTVGDMVVRIGSQQPCVQHRQIRARTRSPGTVKGTRMDRAASVLEVRCVAASIIPVPLPS